MPLQKQNLNINFAQGLDTKTDPNQVQPGKFVALENSVFSKGGLLQKRNGFAQLTSLPDTSYKYLNTFDSGLIAIGTSLASYSGASQSWTSKGTLSSIQLDTLALIRNSSNQAQVDAAVASNNLVCSVYTQSSPSTTYNYAIADIVTGQNIVAPTALATPAEAPRVFVLGNYFIILWSESTNLKYISIPINNPSSPSVATTLVTNYEIGGTQLAFDGKVFNNNLYIAYNATDGGDAIRMTYLNSFLVRQTAATGTNVAAGKGALMVSVTTSSLGAVDFIWVSFYTTAATTGYTLAVDEQLTSILVATQFVAAGTLLNLTSTASGSTVSIFYELSNTYSYGASLATNIIVKKTCTSAGSLGAATNILRGAGLASKGFLISSTAYMLVAYSSSYQPSYFLINSSGSVVAKLAYSNGGGYLTLGLPSVTVSSNTAYIGYLIKDLIVAANKEQNPISPTPVFTQTGINLATFDFTTDGLNTSEIGANLNISGGLLWTYDGYQIVEQGFNVYPDNVIVTTSTAAGNLKDQTYYYVAIYTWTDNQGNVHRSAPSLAIKQITTGGNTSTNTIKVPTYRLTYKSLVKIELYRWSTDFQTFYQVTSLTSPTLNSLTADSVTITDTLADASIVGNSILYTTGGVVENIGAPATSVMTLFRSRLFLVDAEDKNLLWYSKQVIENTPVEMSDLFTLFVAPTISAQGDTGPITALSSMDDKLIIFKKNAIYYLSGNGPDNTGANNDFSEPVFITSTVGCDDQNSIAFIPQGLMFQSDKGIWLLGRDLSTTYIGSPVENFNSSAVLTALSIPATNQVRFTLNTGETLMYDYFFGQWGTFTGLPAISSTLFQSLHTSIDSYGRAFQESVGSYLDGSRPVLMSFTTGWMNLAGLQGYERAYYFYLLGTYLTPHKLTVAIAYDYNPSATQTTVITPDNYSSAYGGDSLYGGSSVFGGSSNVEQWRIFFEQQKCEAFQISITESYDSSFGVAAGAGLTISGLDLIVGAKSTYPRLRAVRQAG